MIRVLAVVGMVLCLYALYVTHRLKTKGYKPLCDISTSISCSKAFLSKEGKITGFPNPFLGLLFYVIVFFFSQHFFVFYFALAAVFASAYLAYTSYVKQKNFCLVCTAAYLVNVAILILLLYSF